MFGLDNDMELPQPPDEPKSEATFAASDGSDEYELRQMLAWAYSGHHLYCDDGEMQDNREHPFIDFRRDTVTELKDKIELRGLNRLHDELHQNDQALRSAPTADVERKGNNEQP